MCRTMFSSMTMASSTTKPTESVSAISERLSTLKFSRDMAENVPTMDIGSARLGMNVATMDIGSARLGMNVAERLRRKQKMTITTRQMESIRVNFTSRTDSLMEMVRSKTTSR